MAERVEQWRPVIDYEGLYEVSDHGRIRSLPRRGTRGGILRGDQHPAGYPSIRLFNNGHKKHLTIHTLVITAFRGSRPEGQECRHRNGNAADNRLENLIWGTSAENKQDMIRHGRTNSRITHCPQGHEYSETNTQRYKGRRYCRSCNRVRTREGQRRRRAKQRMEKFQ